MVGALGIMLSVYVSLVAPRAELTTRPQIQVHRLKVQVYFLFGLVLDMEVTCKHTSFLFLGLLWEEVPSEQARFRACIQVTVLKAL